MRRRIVGVKLPKRAAVEFFEVDQLEVKKGDLVVVATERGPVVGEVQEAPREVELGEGEGYPNVLHKATSDDLQKAEELQDRERRAMEFCKGLIEEMGLPMKLLGAEYLFDGSKVIFYFTAEQRVDFRSLVRRLASYLRTRIEMRQIGVRDEAKLVGGVGPCGRELCCVTFLRGFDLVSIKMAKEQNLPLNPEKISGVCGRLMCCLSFETETYQQLKERLPKLGKRVVTKYGEGKVIRQNILLQTVTVELEGGGVVTLEIEEVKTP